MHAVHVRSGRPGPWRLLAGLALASLALAPASARKREALPSTGLRSIRFLGAAPDFAYDTGAHSGRLSNLAGRVVVLNFWATWCEPCRAELDVLAKLRAAFGDGAALLTVSAEAPGVARAFVRERRLALPVVEDPERVIFSAYSVEPIPVTLVLGRDGTVRHVSVGQLDWPELEGAVAAAGETPLERADLTPAPGFATLTGNVGTPDL